MFNAKKKSKFDISKIVDLAKDFATNGFKYYFNNGNNKQDIDDLFDILFGTIHNLDNDEKKALKVIIKTSNEYYYKKFMKEIEDNIKTPLLEVVKQLSELRKEFYGNGKNR